MPSNDDLLFAEHAVRAGYVTQEAVEDSLRVQVRMAEMGVKDSLANVLQKRGLLKAEDAALIARRAGLKGGREPIPGYELVGRIGTGAMGSVYLAFQKGMQRHVAIKILRRDLTDDPRQVERLRREAALVGKLDHPYIVRGLDSGETGGLVWFVMEYVDGTTLHHVIKEKGRLPLGDALTLTIQICEALGHAHEHGIVHRDIKPGNILLTKDGRPRLSDYGLAKSETDDALTHVDATLGTPQYIAPEQARNPRDADIQSDIYSLGATLYAMLTGEPPFQGDTLAEIITKVLYQRPQPLELKVEGIPAAAVYLVEKMMAKRREHRYAGPAELLRDLRALTEGRLHVPMGFRGDFDAFVAGRRQRRRLVAAITGVIVLSLGAVGYKWWEKESARRAADQLERERYAQVASPGGQETWTRDTVHTALGELEHFLSRYPQHDQALERLSRWRRQSAALQGVNQLNLEIGARTGAWPPLLRRMRALQRELAKRPDAGVAAREVVRSLAEQEAQRDRDAEAYYQEQRAVAAELALDAAAARFAALAAQLREHFFGEEDSTLIGEAEALSRQFERARKLLDAHFDVYDVALESRQGAAGETPFRKLDAQLERCREAASSDTELGALLKELPPTGRRVEELRRRFEPRAFALRELCGQAWLRVSKRVSELKALREYGAAIMCLDAFGLHALPQTWANVEQVRVDLDEEWELGTLDLGTKTGRSKRLFFDYLGDRRYTLARETLADLEEEGRKWPADKNDALELVRGGRLLLELLDRLAWEPFRQHLRLNRPLDQGIQFGTIRENPTNIERVTLDGASVAIHRKGAAAPLVSLLSSVSLRDLLHYSGLDSSRPRDALVFAALRLTEYDHERVQAEDPTRVKEDLRDIETYLITAERDPELKDMAGRLRDWRHQLLLDADAAFQELEFVAKKRHAEAEALFRGEQYQAVVDKIDGLFKRPIVRTRYVRAWKEDLERLRTAAREALKTRGFADFFPGARIVQIHKDKGALHIDFEDPHVAEWLTLEPGVVSLAARGFVSADAAGPHVGDGAGAVRPGHVLAWEAWDGEASRHPRLFPVSFDNPFDYRRPIEVRFLYRSDAPYTLVVSLAGATFGVLSAEDDREGGRGVRIWHADDLERPDLAFGDRYRPGYLDTRPETSRTKGSTEFFSFRPGRVYRVRFVKEERRAKLFVDGRLVQSGDIKPSRTGSLSDRIFLLSYTSGEIDQLVVTGTLSSAWLRSRKK